MKQYKKPLKFYLLLFVFLSVIVLAYSIYMIVNKSAEITSLYQIWILPIFVTVMYYIGDSLLQKILGKKDKVNPELVFLEQIAEKMRLSDAFLIEEYRRLQLNQKFQQALHIAYLIYTDGENENYTIDKLSKKFKLETLEGKAMQFVIDFLSEKSA